MQTIPSFVYLVPIVMLFGVGMTPGIIATIIFAIPPIVRLTNLGIRGVRHDLIEAAQSFGSTRWQMLWDLQLPMAMRTILAGLNQTLMLALSMVVIAALIGAGGLGLVVNTGLGRLNVGEATSGGIGIVILAIVLDRITQGLGEKGFGAAPSLTRTLAGFFRAASRNRNGCVRSPLSTSWGWKKAGCRSTTARRTTTARTSQTPRRPSRTYATFNRREVKHA